MWPKAARGWWPCATDALKKIEPAEWAYPFMILLKLISWPYVRQHLPRWLLTIAGIVLGVAVFVGIHTANQSVVYAFHQTVDRIAGSTQLQISAGETGFEENVLERVQAVPEVRVA